MSELYIGLMSGTSMDAVDAALVDFSDDKLELLATHKNIIPPILREELIDLSHPGEDEVNRLSILDIKIAELFAKTSNELLTQAKIPASDIKAIGSHGQTIRHKPQQPYPFTLQIGDPNTIAARTGITVVADFRRRDMAEGGQGAPLVPLFHEAIFRTPLSTRTVVNIGGIANITILPKDYSEPILGFDTGPGNTLLDNWISKNNQLDYDKEGQWAASGKIKHELLEDLLNDPYFSLSHPKSTGKEYFNLDWLDKFLTKFSGVSPHDVQSTLLELTAQSIAGEVLKFISHGDVIIVGGGAKNTYLYSRLSQLINSNTISLHTSQHLGIAPDWIEAMAFAWLAKQTLEKKPLNLRSITGSIKPITLGGVYSSS